MTSTERVLAIRGLSVNFGGLKALTNVDIDLHKGEVLGLIGPNGAGKTTVFNALSGLVTPASGSLSTPISTNFISYRFSISRQTSFNKLSTCSSKTALRYLAGNTK